MTIFHLTLLMRERELDDMTQGQTPKFYMYGSPSGFVIVARSEQEARSMAAARDCEDEPWWLDDKLTACNVVDPNGPPHIVLGDYPTG